MKNIVTIFLQIQDQLQIFHWQTKSFAQHKAFGKVYERVAELSDSFIETHMGKYGRPVLGGEDVVELENISDAGVNEFIDSVIKFLMELKLDPKRDSDLLNIRDDMMGEFNRLKYLLTLK